MAQIGHPNEQLHVGQKGVCTGRAARHRIHGNVSFDPGRDSRETAHRSRQLHRERVLGKGERFGVEINYVEQNTEQFQEEIAQQIQLQEQLMQELQQNSIFQNFDEQLSNDGLIQQPPSFDMSDEETTVSVPYENDETSATISAEFENGEITNVFIERPTDEIETSLLWVLPLAIGLIAIVVL